MVAIDDNGLPGCIDSQSKQFDGGDSCAILCTEIALGSTKFQPDLMNAFISPSGLPRRHPDITKWYGQTDRFSRDQMIPMICAGIVLGGHPAVDALYHAHKKLGFMHAWNTKGSDRIDREDKDPDVTGPEIWALWERYWKTENWKLPLWDAETLVGAYIWQYRKIKDSYKKRKDPEYRGNRVSRNHMLVSIIANKYLPTSVSKKAYQVNDFEDLIARWDAHCNTVGEWNTSQLFREAINGSHHHQR